MTYSEAIQFLYNLRLFGAKFGLENTFKLARLAGNPQERLSFIHVAGTNGKGSTCAMLESIYRAAGWRVGLFTSPHLVSFSERIQIDREPISEADVVRLVSEIQGLLNDFPAASHPTFFEVITVMALRYFAEKQCDLVVWETGLGGRLDATNIVTPLASVITNVQLDHQQYLGNTIVEIAAEKAGIIKNSVPVITATDDPSALRVVAQTAQERQAALTVVTRAELERAPLNHIHLPLIGEHQRLNAALALATITHLQSRRPVSATAIAEGLRSVDWAGRLQLVQTVSGQTLLLDGAHNPAGVETLRAALETFFSNTKPALILGVLRDKDWRAMCAILAPIAKKIFLTPVPSERTAMPELLQTTCHEANPVIQIIPCESLTQVLSQAAAESFLVLTGSLYLVGETLELLHLTPHQAHQERGLNEWSTPSATSVVSSLRP
jgi:dihydrofolate synthase / folylpolyglutamate synthase